MVRRVANLEATSTNQARDSGSLTKGKAGGSVEKGTLGQLLHHDRAGDAPPPAIPCSCPLGLGHAEGAAEKAVGL